MTEKKEKQLTLKGMSSRGLKLIRIKEEKLIAAIKGEKNAKSVLALAKKFGTSIWASKRAVERLGEQNKHVKLRVTMKREGERGALSQCYFVEA